MGELKYFNKYKKYCEKLIKRKNKVDRSFYNGFINRYENPVITKDHIPLEWRYDLNEKTNPYFIERLGVNATFNAGAIYFNGEYCLCVRVEGTDRKSFFAIARSKSPVDNFRFTNIVEYGDVDGVETNAYDMRLVKHEDGNIYGIYCSESKDQSQNDTSSALANVGIVVTKDLIHFRRLPNLIFKSGQQRNVTLHPEFVNGKYAFYTRPQDEFISVGNGGGIGLGYVDDINNPVLYDEVIIDRLRYHTIYELKNGEGPSPIKGSKGWIHFAHGVRNTAAGLRYVLYCYTTSFDDITEIISKPSGYLIAPINDERIGDVSNVLFTNGVIEKDGMVYLYYASSDTRLHVASAKLEELEDYLYNNPQEMFRSIDCVKQRMELIERNKKL